MMHFNKSRNPGKEIKLIYTGVFVVCASLAILLNSWPNTLYLIVLWWTASLAMSRHNRISLLFNREDWMIDF